MSLSPFFHGFARPACAGGVVVESTAVDVDKLAAHRGKMDGRKVRNKRKMTLAFSDKGCILQAGQKRYKFDICKWLSTNDLDIGVLN